MLEKVIETSPKWKKTMGSRNTLRARKKTVDTTMTLCGLKISIKNEIKSVDRMIKRKGMLFTKYKSEMCNKRSCCVVFCACVYF